MAFGGKAQRTKQGKCLPCGGAIKWVRLESVWTLCNMDDTRHKCIGDEKKESEPEPEPKAESVPSVPRDDAAFASLQARVDALGKELERVKADKPHTFRFAELPPGDSIKTVPGHANMLRLMRGLAADQPIMLFGPPGTGKSEAVRLAGQTLGQRVVELTLGPADTPSRILGYVNPATDRYVPTEFTTGFQEGAILLIDEVCIASPAVLTVLNPAFGGAGCTLSTPGGAITRHERTRLVLADNTDGMGQDAAFPTRRALDLSFRSRTVAVEWPEDQALTLAVTAHLLRDRKAHAETLITAYRSLKDKDEHMPVRRVTLRTLYAAARLMAADASLSVAQAISEVKETR